MVSLRILIFVNSTITCMVIDFLLAMFYLAISLFVLLRVSQSYKNQLSGREITFSFIIKVLFGIAYGVIFLKYYGGDDTWTYHRLSLISYQELLHHPVRFFTDFSDVQGTTGMGSVFDVKNSFWDHLEEAVYIRFLALLNLFSFGHYYTNVVLFCLLVYIGHLLLYRLFISHFPSRSFLFKLVIFFFPVILFWLSGLRKDGILFLALALVLFYFNRLLTERFRLTHLLLFLTGLFTLFLFRNLMVLCLLPAFFAWYACSRFRVNAIACFTVIYATAIAAFFLTTAVKPVPDLPEKMVRRQQTFMALKGNTRLPLDSLKPEARSFLQLLPASLNHTFLRPYLTEAKSPLHLAASLDNLLFFFILLLAFFFPATKRAGILKHPLILTCLFSALSGYIFIGYIVPFPGAIIRYKVIFELLFLCSFAALIDTHKIAALVRKKDNRSVK